MYYIPETEQPNFPPVNLSNNDGLLAIGGKLNTDWLLRAYHNGIFPWFNENSPILWWSPDPRAVMKPSEIKISKSMKVYFNQKIFELKVDYCFSEVIKNCKNIKRKDQPGTWITSNMLDNYVALHKLGYAHSFETWQNGELVGGLYGVSLGRAFFGESMFSKVSNASKFAFISMCNILQKNNFHFIDCQISNNHLTSLGCNFVNRDHFIKQLIKSNKEETIKGNWNVKLKHLNYNNNSGDNN